MLELWEGRYRGRDWGMGVGVRVLRVLVEWGGHLVSGRGVERAEVLELEQEECGGGA